MPESHNEHDWGERTRQAKYYEQFQASRENPQHAGEGELPLEVATAMIRDVDDRLVQDEDWAEEELEVFLRQLDSALAISNDPKANELRKEVLKRLEAKKQS